MSSSSPGVFHAFSNAALSGTFAIGGDLVVNRLGFGAMRITGPGIWGEPTDVEEARRAPRRLPELGINIDTAESYGLRGQRAADRGRTGALWQGHHHRHQVGWRQGPNIWQILGRPEFLEQGVHMSLRRLEARAARPVAVAPDRWVPRDEQFDAIKGFIADGLIRHAGLSEVSVAEIKAAQKFFRCHGAELQLFRPWQRGRARILRGRRASASSRGRRSRLGPSESDARSKRWAGNTGNWAP